ENIKNIRTSMDASFYRHFMMWDDKRKGDYFRSRGINTNMGLQDSNLLPGGVYDVWSRAGYTPPSAEVTQYYADKAKGSRETVDVNLSVNGRGVGTLQADPLTARKMKQTLYSMQHGG